MRALPIAALTLAALSASCAQGGDGTRGADGGRGRRDGGQRGDSGGGGCTARGAAGSCQDATDLGTVAPGGRVESMEGVVERLTDTQWMRVSFPPMTASPSDGSVLPDGGVAMSGAGAPTIRFALNEGDVYRFEVRDACGTVASCGEGGSPTMMATNLTGWSFQDDPSSSAAGPGQYSTRDTPWPSEVYVRVYPVQDPDCGAYQIEITR